MATLINRDYFINTYGTDVVCAYFDFGPSLTGGGRYKSAIYQICHDDDWVRAIAALRKAACLFKLPIDASASVDIVFDNKNADVPPTFFVEIHRSAHPQSAECKKLQREPDKSIADALAEFNRSFDKVLSTLPTQPDPGPGIPVATCADAGCDGGVPMDCPDGTIPECDGENLRCVDITFHPSDLRKY